MTQGTLFVVSAPSGAGKTSLVKHLRERVKGFTVSVSHTTRAQRTGELEGVDYCFTDHAAFLKMVESGAFLEHAKVFDNYYGTSRQSVDIALAGGNDVLLEIDWQGARQIKTMIPDCISVFILPPSRSALEHRLRGRGQDDDATIARRMRDATSEMQHYSEYDFLVINDQFDQALNELTSIVVASRLRTVRQSRWLATQIEQLLR